MTPDQDLSARLLPCPFCGGEAGSCPDPNHSTGWDVGCFNGDCDIEPHVWAVHHATAIDQWNHRSGQLITLADHERAVQAAVAKAVDEMAPAIPHDNDCINFARYNSDECSCGRDVWIADIRARKEATP